MMSSAFLSARLSLFLAASFCTVRLAGISSSRADATLPQPKLQPPNRVHLAYGQSVSSQIDVTVPQSFHLQANPASKPNLIATVLEITPPPGILLKSIHYPPGIPFRLGQVSEPIETYQDHFAVEFVLQSSAKPSPHAQHPAKNQLVTGKLKYQACDQQTCFRPSDVPFEFWVETR